MIREERAYQKQHKAHKALRKANIATNSRRMVCTVAAFAAVGQSD